MPVTVHPANHPARRLIPSTAHSAEELFRASCPNEARQCKRLIRPPTADFTRLNIIPSSNGFVMAAYKAYSHHHHLIIRPEDVWFSILTQISFYINAHAEELRSSFVNHTGQKEILVTDVGSIDSVDVGTLVMMLTDQMKRQLVDPQLHDWIMPSFTTTTQTDTVTAAVIMMGTMQKYFNYRMSLTCGIPSVTLLGIQADWIDIRQRLDKLPQFGREPEQFRALLCPVLDHFIYTFEDPLHLKVVDFWTKIADKHSNSSGPSYLSGWITAFCFWDCEGNMLYRQGQGGCDIDGTSYHRVNTEEIPSAYMSVPVVVDDNGKEIDTKMIAGLLGMAASSSGERLDVSEGHKAWVQKFGPFAAAEFVDVLPLVGDDTGLDTLQPVTGWFMHEWKQPEKKPFGCIFF
ncbi:hypothetical protein G6011_08091 [Alternaria panax]|uniref:Uncharacterized protein n=1 Tax=Alternaria panax TaxID=48097 RepID=A0AAD4I8D5_9PLEO|nr:hypothetical protein G6011_08091 [Alternaria panax]